jgi:hypothetical protein
MAPRTPVTREDLRREVGEIDDLLAAELLASGASLEEIIEKVRAMQAESEEDDEDYPG